MSSTTKTKSNYSAADSNVKSDKGSYSAAVRAAYNRGYRDGYSAYDYIEKRTGWRTAAKHGYGRGMSAHKKVDKIQAKVNRKE